MPITPELILEVDSAIFEVERLTAKRDGLHRLHNISAILIGYQLMLQQGRWQEINNPKIAAYLTEARAIALRGFPLKPDYRCFQPEVFA